MLSPQALESIVGAPVTDVRLVPFSSVDGRSGSVLQGVRVNGAPRFVLKRIDFASDIAMLLSADDHVRSVALWKDGVLDRLPSAMVHGIVACARDGESWALLLDDFSGYLLPADEQRLSRTANTAVLDALAAMHTIFWEDQPDIPAHQSLCPLAVRAVSLSPEAIRPYAQDFPLMRVILDAWELLPSLVNTHVADLVEALHRDITPLCTAMERYPQTLIHGDWHHGNLGRIQEPESRIIVLDWGLASAGPAAVDLAEYLAVGSMRLPGSKDETIETYRRSLCIHLGARFDDSWWKPQLELALLGEFLRLGWNKALTAVQDPSETVRRRERAEIAWWAEHAILGATWL